MIELIEKTLNILQQSAEIIKTPTVTGAVTGFIDWLKEHVFKKETAKEKLDRLRQDQPDESTLIGLKAIMENVLEGEEQLISELERKVEQLESRFMEIGIEPKKMIFNNVNVENSKNVTVIQGSKLRSTQINGKQG